MKLNKLKVSNFKSLKDIEIIFDENINIFIGKNNSGKSNIVKSLLFLSTFATESIENTLGKFGGVNEIIYGKEPAGEISFILTFTMDEYEKASFFSKINLSKDSLIWKSISNQIKYSLSLHEVRNIVSESLTLVFNGNEIIYHEGSWNESNQYEHRYISDLRVVLEEDNWELISGGASSPAHSIFRDYYQFKTNGDVRYFLIYLLRKYLSSWRNLESNRGCSGQGTFEGKFKLNPNANDLPKVLNSLASTKRKVFESIIKSSAEIIEDVHEIRAPPIENTQEIYISLVDNSFKNIEFSWDQTSSGTKEIIYLLTLLYTADKGSLIIIEEPELHVHEEAMKKFLVTLKKISTEHNKQIVITTHSSMLLDSSSFDSVFVVTRELGETSVEPLKDHKEVEGHLSRAGIPKSWLLLQKAPSYLLILEGRDDYKIFESFFRKKGIDLIENKIVILPSSKEGGGFHEAMKMGKMLKRIKLPIPFKIVLDSDNKKSEKECKLKEEGFSSSEYHVLLEKEIDSYLIEAGIIAKSTCKSAKEVDEIIKKSSGAGKEKLENILKVLGVNNPTPEVKGMIALQMEEIPTEISAIIDEIQRQIS